jgi:catechol 2,3-dioxygenase-like lactoylglutathione lyase family enzyme
MSHLNGFDHVQLAMPAGQEDQARAFYGDILGLCEIEKPEPLRARGGCWFNGQGFQIHLGVEEDFRPARKAHPAFLVADLAAFKHYLQQSGIAFQDDTTVAGVRRLYIADPFGNRIECIQDGDGFNQRSE